MLVALPLGGRHGITPAGSRATICAKVSNVISFFPRAEANWTKDIQWGAGTPRRLQPLTVDLGRDSAAATLPVPPRASRIDPAVIIDWTIIRRVRNCQGFATHKTTFPSIYGPIRPMIDPPEIVGPRLKALRLALGVKTQTAFAKAIGVGISTYNPWEKATRPLTFEGACLIRAKYHIPLDYLFFGDALDELPNKVVTYLKSAA